MSDDDPDIGLRLDDQLCFALYAATNAITRRYRPLLGEIGLTYPQYLVMLTLWQDGRSPVGRLAARLELDSHAVSPIVDRLVRAGLVVRRAAADRRQVLVELTGRGRDLEEAAARAQAQVACETGLEAYELADLRRRLRELAAELGADPALQPPRGSRAASQQASRRTTTEGEAS